MAKARVAILISGRGSNMAALVYTAKRAECPFEIVLVAANDPCAPGLTLAKAEGISTFAQSHKGMKRADFDAVIHAELQKADAEYVALAGYMRLLSPEFVALWEGRMLNIHPSLLPAYKGLDTHERALANGDKVAGCSVHVVTAALDDGPVLGQIEVAIIDGDTPESLAERTLIAEHQLYAHVLADYVVREADPAWLLGNVRERALAQPEADEITSHGMPCFGIIGGKKFAYFTDDHHGDGRTALLVKISGVDEQAMLIENNAARYFRPAYFGDSWIAIRLDLGDNDWDALAEWIARSWAAVAPKRLVKSAEFAARL